MASPTDSSSVRERIMDASFDLFYRQGYRATGINQLIKESGVAKASFYDHFPSKADLLHAYVREAHERDVADVRDATTSGKTAWDRFFGPLTMLPPWFKSTNFRGCPFQNVIAEVPCEDARIHELLRAHRERIRELFRNASRDLVASDKAYRKIDAEDLADTYMVLFEGAIVLATAYKDLWPIDHAIKTLEARLERG